MWLLDFAISSILTVSKWCLHHAARAASTASKHLAGFQIVTLRTNHRIRMASLAGLQVPPRFRRVIRSEYESLGIPDRLVRFDAHAALVPYLVVMAIRAEPRLVAAIAALRTIILCFYRMDRDEVGPMRRRHGLPGSRQTFPQVGFDVPAFVAVETERLLMAIGAIVSPLLRQ